MRLVAVEQHDVAAFRLVSGADLPHGDDLPGPDRRLHADATLRELLGRVRGRGTTPGGAGERDDDQHRPWPSHPADPARAGRPGVPAGPGRSPRHVHKARLWRAAERVLDRRHPAAAR